MIKSKSFSSLNDVTRLIERLTEIMCMICGYTLINPVKESYTPYIIKNCKTIPDIWLNLCNG